MKRDEESMDRELDAALKRSGEDFRSEFDDALGSRLERHRNRVIGEALSRLSDKKQWIPHFEFPVFSMTPLRWAAVGAMVVVGLILVRGADHGTDRDRRALELVFSLPYLSDYSRELALRMGEEGGGALLTYAQFSEDLEAVFAEGMLTEVGWEEESSLRIDYQAIVFDFSDTYEMEEEDHEYDDNIEA